MSNPWNEGFKPSNSHPTHGMKASNHPTPTYNPWHEDLKPASDTHGTKASNCPTPTYNPWNFQPHQMMTGTYCTLALHHCSFIFRADLYHAHTVWTII